MPPFKSFKADASCVANARGGLRWFVRIEHKRDVVQFHGNDTRVQKMPAHAAELHLGAAGGNGGGEPSRVLCRIDTPEKE
jgi:hypothetical protein